MISKSKKRWLAGILLIIIAFLLVKFVIIPKLVENWQLKRRDVVLAQKEEVIPTLPALLEEKLETEYGYDDVEVTVKHYTTQSDSGYTTITYWFTISFTPEKGFSKEEEKEQYFYLDDVSDTASAAYDGLVKEYAPEYYEDILHHNKKAYNYMLYTPRYFNVKCKSGKHSYYFSDENNMRNFDLAWEACENGTEEKLLAVFSIDGKDSGLHINYGYRDRNPYYQKSAYKKKSGSSSYSGSYGGSYSDSYDDGYADIYEDGDYDDDRYRSDSDYASGVDDAMEDEGW